MSQQRHIVKRQVIELKVQNPRTAPVLQDEVSRIYRQRVIPLIDRYCTELGQPDRLYRIDSLELDLGRLETDDLEGQFVAKVEAALRKALSAQIAVQEQEPASSRGHGPKAQSALELFAFFARTGSLPWWADSSQPDLLAETLQSLLDESPDELRRLLQTLAGETRARERIIRRYEDTQLAQLAALLVPAHRAAFKHTKALIALLQKTNTVAASWPPAQTRQRFWEHLIQVAALGGQGYPAPEDFYQAVLKRFAMELSVTGRVLVDEMQQAVQDEQAGSSRPFKELLRAMAASEAGLSGRLGSELAQRLERLRAASPESLQTAWAALQAALAHIPDSAQTRWLAVLKDAASSQTISLQGADSQNAIYRVLEVLAPEHASQYGLPEIERSRLDRLFRAALQTYNKQRQPAGTPAIAPKDLAARLRRYRAEGGPLAQVWAALQTIYVRLPSQVQSAWADALNAPDSAAAAQNVIRLLNAGAAQHGLRFDERAQLLQLLRAAEAEPIAERRPPPDLGFSDADELSVQNAGLVILWPFLTNFFTHLGLVDEQDRQFKNPAAQQRGIGLLQVLADGQADLPEYLLPLNKLLCGLEADHVFDFGRRLRKKESKACEELIEAVITQVPMLNNMSVDGFRGSFLLRPGMLTVNDGMWLLRVEHQTYDIILERFPWSWQWVKLPWMEMPLQVDW